MFRLVWVCTLTPCRTAVSVWGQASRVVVSILPPERDFSPEGDSAAPKHFGAGYTRGISPASVASTRRWKQGHPRRCYRRTSFHSSCSRTSAHTIIIVCPKIISGNCCIRSCQGGCSGSCGGSFLPLWPDGEFSCVDTPRIAYSRSR